jgi:hypothetical protein
MPIPPYAGVRTYFVLAEVEPKEVMNFRVEDGIQLDEDTTLEVMGHALAYWRPSGTELDILELRAAAQDMFDVTLAIDALVRLEAGEDRLALSRRATIQWWLEAREVEARANVIGTVHARYRLGNFEVDGKAGRNFAAAAKAAWAVRMHPNARLAFKDFGVCLADVSDDAFFFAYRAIENVRRYFATDAEKSDWGPMHAALGTTENGIKPLTSAATAIRHGQGDGTGLIAARGELAREQTLAIGDDVLRRFLRHEGLIA